MKMERWCRVGIPNKNSDLHQECIGSQIHADYLWIDLHLAVLVDGGVDVLVSNCFDSANRILCLCRTRAIDAQFFGVGFLFSDDSCRI